MSVLYQPDTAAHYRIQWWIFIYLFILADGIRLVHVDIVHELFL